MKKRIISLFLALVLVLTVFPNRASAASTRGVCLRGGNHIFENRSTGDAKVCAKVSINYNSRADWVILAKDGSLKEYHNDAIICYLHDQDYVLASGEKMIVHPMEEDGIEFSWDSQITKTTTDLAPIQRYLLQVGTSYVFSNNEAEPQNLYFSGDINFYDYCSANSFADFITLKSDGSYYRLGCDDALAFLNDVCYAIGSGERFIVRPLYDAAEDDYIIAFTVNYGDRNKLSCSVSDTMPITRYHLEKGNSFSFTNNSTVTQHLYFSGNENHSSWSSANSLGDFVTLKSDGDYYRIGCSNFFAYLDDKDYTVEPGERMIVKPLRDYTENNYVVAYAPNCGLFEPMQCVPSEEPIRRFNLLKGSTYLIENHGEHYLPLYFSGSSTDYESSINATAEYAIYNNDKLVSTHQDEYISFLSNKLYVLKPGDSWVIKPTSDYTDKDYIIAFTPCSVSESELTVNPFSGVYKTNPFDDVVKSEYYYNAVLWAYWNDPQITNGTDTTHFSPNMTCTREQIVTFLWAANGKPEPTGTGSTFSDVATDAWYFKPVMWAVENGYTSGMGDGSFGVGQPCTRAQAMTFLWAAQGKPEPTSTVSPFNDVATGDWFCKPILWAAENGITAGIGDGLFGVNNTCTRAQIITFLYKAYGA